MRRKLRVLAKIAEALLFYIYNFPTYFPEREESLWIRIMNYLSSSL